MLTVCGLLRPGALLGAAFGAFELADTAVDPAERSRWLTFALVGAGPTGVELAGQIREVATKTLRDEYRHIKPEDARVLLFDGGDAPLTPFGPELSAKAARTLTKLGVEQHMHSIVTDIDGTGLSVRAQDGTVTRHEAGWQRRRSRRPSRRPPARSRTGPAASWSGTTAPFPTTPRSS